MVYYIGRMMNTKLEISIKTIILTLLLLLAGWVVFIVQDILFLLFIAFLLMTAIHPLVLFLERFKIPRAIGILLTYGIVFGFFGASLASAIPALIVQSTKLVQDLPAVIAKIIPYWNIDVSTISQQIAPIGESVVKVTLSIFSNIVTLVTILVFTFYFLIERKHADIVIQSIVGEGISDKIMVILRKVETRLGGWIRGQLILMTTIGLLSYIGLSLLHVDYALPLAILAGTLELIPMIGPTVSAIPAILVALSISPLLALSVLAMYVVVQQLENNILVPYVMKKSVGFPPIVTILVLMIGGRFAGVIGAILAIPVALVVQEISLVYLFTDPSETSPSQQKITKNPSK
jgi:predicted PurR-regulated permease PerM